MDRQRIIVVEDESIVSLDIKLQLEHLGYEVPAMFPSGEELLAALPDVPADLVLLDIILKGTLDGVETAKLVKERFNLPVILLTALDTQETLERAKLVQPFAFIVKPFDERELRNAVVISLYRHAMEQELHQRERLFSTTLESIQDGVLITDEQFLVEYTNPVADAILGFGPDEVRGASMTQVVRLVHEDGSSVAIGEGDDAQLYVARPDGSRLPVERDLSPLLTQQGDRQGWVVVIRDVSERLEQERALHQQQEQLRRSQKMEAIGRLTGGIAHDFNNLLTVILGYARLLRDEIDALGESSDGVDVNALRADVDGIQKASMRSASLTRQLLAFSRPQVMERRVVDVNQVVSDMERMLQRLVSDDVRTQVDLLATDARVRIDPSQLEQVLMNLAVNARDAMPAGGRLSIRTDVRELDEADLSGRRQMRAGRFVAVEVRDTGTGMSADVAERVFEPFFTTKEVGQGTGLGLSTVYGIVGQSGGFVDLDTEEGRGTTFTVYLPLFEGDAQAVGEREITADSDGGSETILLVEDEEAIRELLARVLRRRGYHVFEASNAGEALLVHERQSETIDLLITDIVMPHLSGNKLAERLVERRPTLKVLFMSAYPESYLDDAERERLGGRFMQKPVDPARFVARVRTILDE